MQSEVSYCLMHCVFCIYEPILMSLLHITICLNQEGLLLLYCICLCCVFHYFPMRQDASTPVVSMDILNYSISNFVTSVEFAKTEYLSTLIYLHGCCSLFSVVRMNRMMHTGALLDSVGNTHSIILFSHTTVSMEVKPRMELTL